MPIFEVLGPVRVRRDDGSTLTPTGLQSQLLGLLLANPGRLLTHDRLADAMWGCPADPRMVHRLQTHVHRLRSAVGDLPLAADPGGYRLQITAEQTDAGRFESLVSAAADVAAQQPAQAAALAREALNLWRGRPFHGLETEETAAASVRLQHLRVTAWEELYAAELTCGHHELVADELPPVVDQHPLRERLRELLMMSHAAAGRQADALAVFHEARSVLRRELGVEPGPGLQDLQARILSGAALDHDRLPPAAALEALSRQRAGVHGACAAVEVPAQLPARPRGFIGRDAEQSELWTWLDDDHRPASLFTLIGGAGVGKTALALHWAHEIAHRFPDGHLAVDLRGYGPEDPVPAEQALAGFLRALGTDVEHVPDGLDERAAAFRSQTAERRLLILLDNARDVSQVRPLLPGGSGSLVIVTSRTALTGLVLQEGAHQIALSTMGDDDSRRLLGQLLGPAPSADQLETLADRCAHLPLALRVAAERVRGIGSEDLPTVLEDLEDLQDRLDVLDLHATGDQASSMRAVFSWSYLGLEPTPAWLFRCFGVAPAHELSLQGLSALAGLELRIVRQGVEGLRRAHLVESCGPHRYRLHDLLRSYAIELTEDHEGDTVREACLDRLCRHYLRGVAAALEILMPEEMTIPEARDLLDADTVRPFSRKTDAAEWLEQELPHLLVTAEHCADGGQPRFAVVLSKLLRRHLDRSPYLHSAHRLHTAAFLAGRRLEDLAAQGHSLRMLGRVALLRVQLEESRELLERSVDCHLRAGEEREAAVTRGLLGGAHAYRGDIRGALREHRSSVDTLRALDDPAVCFSLANWGLAHHLLGEADEARRLLHEAVDISRQRGSPYGESVALLNLTLTYASTGEHEAALDLARRTLRLATRLGRRARACQALVSAGEALHGVGRRKVGHRLVRLALTEAEDLGQRDIIATAHLALGGLTREARALQHSRSHLLISLEQARGHWDLEALTLISLGETCSATQDPDGAREAWGQALAIYERVGHAHTPVLRRRLQGVESPAVT